jgi:hypothetical protein
MILEHPEKTTGLPQVNGKSYHKTRLTLFIIEVPVPRQEIK